MTLVHNPLFTPTAPSEVYESLLTQHSEPEYVRGPAEGPRAHMKWWMVFGARSTNRLVRESEKIPRWSGYVVHLAVVRREYEGTNIIFQKTESQSDLF